MRTYPSVPTESEDTVPGAVPEIRAPLAVMHEQGIAEAVFGTQVRPSEQSEQAVSTLPFAPTGRATGTPAARPVTKVPLAVIQAQGIGGTPFPAAVTLP